MENHDHNSIRQAVLEKIKSGEVRKYSRAYFVLRVAAALVVSSLLLIVSAIVFSFMLFSFHESGQQFLLGFGWQGVLAFFMLFPWPLFILDILLLFVLEWLLQGFKFGYRMPLLNFGAALFAVSLITAMLINLTPIHGFLLHRADRNQLPFVGGAYEHIFDHHEDQGVCRGIVSSTTPDGFIMQHNDMDRDRDEGEFTVSLAPGVSSPMPPVQIGDRVLVFGHPDSFNHIEAQDVQVLPPPDWQP